MHEAPIPTHPRERSRKELVWQPGPQLAGGRSRRAGGRDEGAGRWRICRASAGDHQRVLVLSCMSRASTMVHGDCLHGRLTTGGRSCGLWSSVWEGGRRGRRPANLQRAPASAQGARRRPTPPHLHEWSCQGTGAQQGKVQPGGSGEGRGSRFVRRVAPEPGGAPGRPPSGHFLVGIGGCQCYNP